MKSRHVQPIMEHDGRSIEAISISANRFVRRRKLNAALALSNKDPDAMRHRALKLHRIFHRRLPLPEGRADTDFFLGTCVTPAEL
jgi:hypothetical protein